MMGCISYADIVWFYFPLILVVELAETSECPQSGKVYNTLNYCYWVDTIARQFTGADDECKTNGGRLARIPDVEAKDFIENNFRPVISVSNVWIGVKTDDYINFTSVEGDLVTYLPWLTSYTYNGQCLLLDTAVSPYVYKEELCSSYHISLCYLKIGKLTTESTMVQTTQAVPTTEKSTIPLTATSAETTVATTETTKIVVTTEGMKAPSPNATKAIFEETNKVHQFDGCFCLCTSTTNLKREETMTLLSSNLGRLTNILSSSVESISDILRCSSTTRCQSPREDFRSCKIMII